MMIHGSRKQQKRAVSYTHLVVMAYPLIGNYGIAEEDFETETPTIGGLVVRDYNDQPSNFRSKYTLSEIMEKYQISGIYGIDTRKLVRSIRDLGSRKVLITSVDTSLQDGPVSYTHLMPAA